MSAPTNTSSPPIQTGTVLEDHLSVGGASLPDSYYQGELILISPDAHTFSHPMPSSFARGAIQPRGPRVVQITEDHASLSRIVELLVDSSGLAIAEVARRMGVQPQTVHQYIAGNRTNPSMRQVARIAAVCGAKVYVELG